MADYPVTDERESEAQDDERPESPDAEQSDEAILAEAKARYELAAEAWKENRQAALEDLKFAEGEQWPDEIKQARSLDRRPCLVINKIPQFLQQITNDQRQNRPSLKAHPVDSAGDLETGKIISGVIRHIEYNSNADAAYDTGFEGAAGGGFGFWRVVTEYVDPLSFDQEILIKRIPDHFSVLIDPHSKEPDGSDMNYGFIEANVPKEDYGSEHAESKLGKDWASHENLAPGWVTASSCRVVEYYCKKFKSVDIVLLSDGQVIEKEKLPEYVQAIAAQGLGPINLSIVNERKARVPQIKWYKLNGVEILDRTDWVGRYIPIIPVYGSDKTIDGKRVLKGVVRNAKDSQRMYNYWKSAQTEAIALAPRAPFIAAKGQIEGFEKDWETANTRNHSVLEYNQVDVNGKPAPPPQRQAFEPAVQSITQAALQAADDMKATTGIYDASLGNRSNESSGIAIQRRNQQAQTSNFHFVDNLTRSLRHTGRILIDLIPKIYDTERVLRIIGEDGEQKVVKVNGPTDEIGKDGKPLIYRLDAGKYDVTVDVGPSFASKRQEAAASMMEFAKAVPNVAAGTADLIAKNQDWPGAQEFAERIKKMLPPGLADEPDKKKQPIPPEVQQQMQQMSQMVEQLTGKLNELQAEREQKLLELESKERIEMKKLEVQLEIKRAELDAKDSLALLNAEIKSIEQRLGLLQMAAPIQANDGQQVEMQPDGGQPAELAAAPEDPTGGESPGLPMEGEFSDDPSTL